jgi:hypothetical protein
MSSCVCGAEWMGETDPLPFTHEDGCPVWEDNKHEWDRR